MGVQWRRPGIRFADHCHPGRQEADRDAGLEVRRGHRRRQRQASLERTVSHLQHAEHHHASRTPRHDHYRRHRAAGCRTQPHQQRRGHDRKETLGEQGGCSAHELSCLDERQTVRAVSHESRAPVLSRCRHGQDALAGRRAICQERGHPGRRGSAGDTDRRRETGFRQAHRVRFGPSCRILRRSQRPNVGPPSATGKADSG